MAVCNLDFETRATVELRTTGVYPYAVHENTGLWCLCYSFDDEEDVYSWRRGDPFPERLREHIAAGGEMRAWNAQFERVIWQHHCAPRLGWPAVPFTSWRCTMAEARAMALPGGLDAAARVLKVAAQKDAEGYGLMMRMTKPRSVSKEGGIVWWDVSERVERLVAYCQQDVRAERAVGKCLRRLSAQELAIYQLDQRMNDRGIPVDLELVHAAKEIVHEGLERANLAMREVTGGSVASVSKLNDLKQWLFVEHEIDATSLDKASIKELLSSDLSEAARQAIELRADAGRSSLAKLDSMKACVGADDKARGLLQYHAATTGRWGGRLIQPQNFPRPTIDNIEDFIPEVLANRYDTIDLYHSPFEVIVSMLRSMLTASPGNRLIAADYSAIEARVLNYLAGQNDYVQMFRDGVDVYKVNAMKLYGLTMAEVLKFPHRQTGKFQELGCGYQMGWLKAMTAAKDVYGLTITEEQAKEIVKGYRDAHPYVVSFWKELNGAALNAVGTPGMVFTAGQGAPVNFTKRGAYLWLILPSGRPLAYAAPAIKEVETPWSREARKEAQAHNAWVRERIAAGELPGQLDLETEKSLVEVPVPEPEYRDAVVCWGVDSFTKQWAPFALYGGLLAENVVQAVSRDIMAEAMLRVDDNGYPVILSVHDEIIADVPIDSGSVAEFEHLLVQEPSWAPGCPIAAEGWAGFRYRK